MAVTASNWRLQNKTPFGSPVVPDVNTKATGRSGSSGSAGGTAPRTRQPSSNESTFDAGSRSASRSTRAGSATPSTASCSTGDRRVLTPAVIAPTLTAAR